MFFACYIKWFESLDKAFEEAALLENPSFRIRIEFFGDEDNTVYSDLEQTLIKEYFDLHPSGIGGCIAEIVIPITTEQKNSKGWVQDKEWDKLRRKKTDYNKTFRYLFPPEREEQQFKELEKEFLEEQSYDIYTEKDYRWQQGEN